MRVLWRSLPLIVLLAALPGVGEEKATTHAQADGFEGQIRSVSTRVEAMPVNWGQPSGPTLVFPVLCWDCEYDVDGNRTRSGQSTSEGTFLGQEINLAKDGQGIVTGRTYVDAKDGTVTEQEQIGPFGPVERTFPTIASFYRQTISYDRLGHEAERLTFDADGNLVERDLTRTNGDGQWTERAVWTGNGHLQYRETYNPETDSQRFESYDESGAVGVTFAFSHNQVTSFWEASEAANQIGDSFAAKLGNGDVDQYKCHKGGACEVFRVHYEYADAAQHYPVSSEWKDSSGKLLYGAYYQYEFDAQHNWTKRVVYVQSPEIPDRTLLETDTRSIVYWPSLH